MNTEEGRKTEKQKAEYIPQNLAKVDEILWYNEHSGREENGKTKGRAYSAKFGEG